MQITSSNLEIMTFSKFKMVTAIVCSLVLELCSLRYLVQILHPLHGDVSILRNSVWPTSAILEGPFMVTIPCKKFRHDWHRSVEVMSD